MFIPLAPMPSPRPRFRVIGKFASAYMPKDYKDWKAACADILKASGISVGDAAVEVTVILVAPKPKSSKLPFPKPDIDNYVKSVLDAATDATTVWTDDWQVADLVSRKRWETPTRPAGITFSIRELTPEEL